MKKSFCFVELKEEVFKIINENKGEKFIEIHEKKVKKLKNNEVQELKTKKDILDKIRIKYKNIINIETKNYKKPFKYKKISYKFNFVGIFFLDFSKDNYKVVLVFPKFYDDNSIDLDKESKNFIYILKSINNYFKHIQNNLEKKKIFFHKYFLDNLSLLTQKIQNPKNQQASNKSINETYKNVINYFKKNDWEDVFTEKYNNNSNNDQTKEKEDEELIQEIKKITKERQDQNFFVIGTNEFEYIWEKSCLSYLKDNSNEFIISNNVIKPNTDNSGDNIKNFVKSSLLSWFLPPSLINNKKEIINNNSLEPDIINLKKSDEPNINWEMNIYDAKYYKLNVYEDENSKIKIKNAPNKQDIFKQILYQLSYVDVFKKSKCKLKNNAFVFPYHKIIEENEKSYVRINLFTSLFNNDNFLDDKIGLLFLNAKFVINHYANEDNIEEQIKGNIKSHLFSIDNKFVNKLDSKYTYSYHYQLKKTKSKNVFKIKIFRDEKCKDFCFDFEIEIPQNE